MKKLTLLGMSGIGKDGMSGRGLAAVSAADVLFCQTKKHVTARGFSDFLSMDDIYDAAESYDELNERIAERIFSSEGDNVLYAALGKMVGSALFEKLSERCRNEGVELCLISSPGFSEYALDALGICEDNVLCIKANAFPSDIDPDIPLVIEEVDNPLMASEIKLRLSEYYPDGMTVFFARLNEDLEYETESFPLFELDRQKKYGADHVLYIPAVKWTALERHGVSDLMKVLYELRKPGGCPWDIEQTHESLKKTLIEETYEVIDAIDRENEADLCEELGDLLLQIAFHAIIEEERAAFTLRDVATEIVNKLIYRHPHVFGDVKADTADEVLSNWEILKRKEKKQKSQEEAIMAIPKSFPALMYSAKVQKKAADVGFDFSGAKEAFYKIAEETDELMRAMNGDGDVKEELGDLFFAVVNVARLLKIDSELALHDASEKFAKRFIKMERLIISEGKNLHEMTLSEMDGYWDRVKLI